MLFWQPGPNRWIGVCLPWTFADRKIWDKSWRLVSRILLVMGITAFISWRSFAVTCAHLVGLGIFYPVLLYRLKYGTLRYWKGAARLDYHPLARCRHCGHWQKLPDAANLTESWCEACRRSLRKKSTP
jgi:hypothetical protein